MGQDSKESNVLCQMRLRVREERLRDTEAFRQGKKMFSIKQILQSLRSEECN